MNCLAVAGETVSYGAWTLVQPGVTDVTIYRWDSKRRQQLFAAARVNAARHVTPGWGGMTYSADTGHEVPEEVEIVWRKWPREGEKWFQGEAVDPYRVKVRSRIPEDVLALSRERGYELRISFAVGKGPIPLCWRLDYADLDFQRYVTESIQAGRGKEIDHRRNRSAVLHQGGENAMCCNLAALPERQRPRHGCRGGKDPILAPSGAELQTQAKNDATRIVLHILELRAGSPTGVTPADILRIEAAFASGADIEGRMLAEHGPVNTTHGGYTPLMLAAGNGPPELVMMLLDRSANVHARNVNGGTALHYAASAGNTESIKLLLARGADPGVANQKGETPLRQAELQGFMEAAAVLKAATVKR
jgi:hypothetical protein